MTLECINPKDLPTPQTYTQVVVATGSKMVFVSGQEPEDIHGKLVGPGDLATQASQVFGNLGRARAAAGARPAQVTRITIYVVNYKRDECLPIIEKAPDSAVRRSQASGRGARRSDAVPRRPDRS